MIDSDVPRADNSDVALESRRSRVATHGRGQVLADRLDVVSRRGRELQGFLGVEPLLADGLGGHLAEGGEVGERLGEAPLDARLGIKVVIRDQRAEVVGGQRDQHSIDELAGSAGAVGGLAGVSRRCLPRPEVRDPRRVGRQKVAELPGHAAEV